MEEYGAGQHDDDGNIARTMTKAWTMNLFLLMPITLRVAWWGLGFRV